jgi:hypothetical protein
MLTAVAFSIVVRTLIEYRQKLRASRDLFRAGDIWYSQFTATDFWLRIRNRNHRYPYQRLASVRVLYGTAFVQLNGVDSTLQVPVELFPEQEANAIRGVLVPQLMAAPA